jgi:molecular chaperone GrpE
VTEDNVEIKEEPTESSIPKEQEMNGAGAEPAADASATDAIEGEIVDGDEEEEIDELTALGEELEQTQAQADEYLDNLRRERAAFQNYKRRQENERAELRQMALGSLLTQILPISDDLERALGAVPEEQSDQPWIEGINLIQRKLRTTLEGNGVVPIEAEPGQPFDPFIHEAVSYEENDSHQEGEIIDVVQKGYKLGERTLRPAMVRVAR